MDGDSDNDPFFVNPLIMMMMMITTYIVNDINIFFCHCCQLRDKVKEFVAVDDDGM